MPFDFDRIIDHQLYLATQQCIQPYVQRRVSSAPAATFTHTAVAAGPARTAGGRKASLGSLISPWSRSSGGSSSSRRHPPAAYPYQARPSAQGYSPVDLFSAAPVGIPVRGGRHGSTTLLRNDSSPSFDDQFVTAPIGDFTDTEDWTFATASGGSGSGTFTGLDTTVENSPAPSHQAGKMATTAPTAAPATASAGISPQPQPHSHSPDPTAATTSSPRQGGLARVSAITLLVEDLARTKRFYSRVFGAPCAFEDATSAALRFNGGALIVNLCESADARDVGLLGPGVRAGERGDVDRRFLLSVLVDDVEEVYSRLRQVEEEGEGVVVEGLTGPVTRPWGMRVVTFRDPAGHCWEVAQDVNGG
ncbi:hypothetical protein Daus18300_007730 [Diaporthe australafricana]|uniref:VOC domain-containing protein n=1 Tax=Diaporthe australafricana TaxID=127596 RepID=A0ABR3WLC7_9PEZI